ncbi:hypothetical protein NYZ01_16540 [Acinetobacter baumannii]|nr:hypothetical protein [Acinetobacter baumannii]
MNTNYNQIYEVLEQITYDEKEIKNKHIDDNSKFDLYLLILGVILFTFSFFLKLIIALTHTNESLEMAFVSLAIIGYIFIITSPAIGILINIKTMYRNFKNPLKILFIRTKNSTKVDAKAVSNLINFDLEYLEFCYMELKHELDDFNKRIINITEPISRVGLFPAILLGLTTISIQLEKHKSAFQNLSTINQFIIFLSIGIIVLYIFSIHANFKSSDLERRIKILEYTINFKKNKKNIIQLV